MKKFWIKKGLMIVLMVIAATLVFGAVVMGLWNAILPAVLGVKAITFMQALGILLLSKILFGGFKGGRGGGGAWKQRMKEKCEHMSPEQRDSFQAEWKNRCGGKWGMRSKTNEAEQKPE
jgi:hypothetical protein